MVALPALPPPIDTITILECTEDRRATKRIYLGPGERGAVIDGYDGGTWFMAREEPVNSFDGLADVLQSICGNPKAFVIRAASSGAWNFEFPVRRTTTPKPMQPAAFRPQPRRWMAIDIDKAPQPAGCDPAEDPEGAVEHLIGRLPEEFQDASCWWQWTSGQGFKGDTLNARLWFWLDKPAGDLQLRAWAKSTGIVDSCLYSAAEPHYIAAPILGPGVHDPVPRRYGVRRGLSDEVTLTLPDVREVAAREWTDRVSRSGGGGDDGAEMVLAEVEDYLRAIPNNDLDYDAWLQVGVRVKSAIGDAGEDAFVTWSEQSRKHDDGVARRKYRSLKGDGNPLGLFFMARDHGYTFDHIFNLTAIIESGMAKRAASSAGQVEDEDWEMPDPAPSDAPLPEDDRPEQSVLATPITHHGRAPLPEPVGLLKDIKDHILASSMYPQPELALAAALVVVGTAMGRRYTFGKKLRANLYALCIAPSGSGKGHVLDQVEQMLVEAKLENCLGGKEPASGAAVNSRLVDHPVTVYAIDEIGMLLEAILDKRAPPHVKDVVKTLTEIFTKSAGRYAEKDRADRSKVAPRTIQHPHLTVFGVTAETHVWGSINKEAVSDGSLARFMVFESREDYPAPVRHPKDSDIPLGITNALRTVYDRGGDPNAGNLAGVSPESPPNLRMVNASPAAAEMFWEATLWEHKNRKKHKASGLSSIYGRFVEQARKLSFIHAIGRDPYRATVEEIDAQWGLEVSAALIEHLVSRINENVAENDQDRTVKRVLQIVVAAGGKGIAVRDLTRKTQWLKMRERREVIDALVAAQQVAEGPEALEPGKTRRGPPRMMVRAI